MNSHRVSLALRILMGRFVAGVIEIGPDKHARFTLGRTTIENSLSTSLALMKLSGEVMENMTNTLTDDGMAKEAMEVNEVYREKLK